MQQEELELLLKLARDSLNSFYNNERLDTSYTLHMKEPRGVFVTLHKNGRLRGCIGYPEPVLPLYRAVIEAARSAALRDPRFPPVTKEEMKMIKIELSILTVPELIKVKNPNDFFQEIKTGRDGLIIRGHDGNSGLLLPQVATEYNFTVSQFLNALCQKANMTFNAWADPRNKVYKFRAEIAHE